MYFNNFKRKLLYEYETIVYTVFQQLCCFHNLYLTEFDLFSYFLVQFLFT